MTSRQPAGIPTGGQFAAGSQGRADVSLVQQVVTHTGPDGETFEFVGKPDEAAHRQSELAAEGVYSTIAPLDDFPVDLPQYAQHYSPEQRRAVVAAFAQKPLAELRKNQDINTALIREAYALATKPNPPSYAGDALEDLQTRGDIFAEAVGLQQFGATGFGPTPQERVDQQRAKKTQLAAAAAHFERMTAQTIADVIRDAHPNADRLELRRVEGRWRMGAVVDAEGNRIETVYDNGERDDTVAMLVDDLEHDPYRSAVVTDGDEHESPHIALDVRHGFWDEAVTYGPGEVEC